MATAQNAFDRARALLNDVNEELYSNAVLLPYLQIANDELSNKMLVHGIPVQKQVADTLTVTAGETEYDPLPDDFVNPVMVWQRPSGQTIDFEKMTRRSWEPGYVRDDAETLGLWDYRNQQIIWQPSITDVEVRLDYNRMLAELDDAADTLGVIGSLVFYGPRVAQLAAKHIGQNPVKALEFKLEADEALDDLIVIAVKNQQNIGTRRKPFRMKRRRYI